MKKFLGCCFLVLCVMIASMSLTTRACATEFTANVSAESAVLISADSGDVLYEKNAYSRLSMASTTKIMTAMLTLESAEISGDSTVLIIEEMVAVEGSSMGLGVGDEITLKNLAAGMLLASGNDAANSAAIFLDGSLEGFADRMNDRAAQLGLKDTHFVTPSGLDDDEHYSTAFDMAQLARVALENQNFRAVCSSSSSQVEFVNPPKMVTYTNHNKLLWQYDGCIGVKTGFTKKSGRCLVSAAERDGVTLICVTLNAPDDWNDHTALLDYGFSSVKSVEFDGRGFSVELPVVGAESDTIKVCGGFGGSVSLLAEDADSITCRALLSRFLYAPVKVGDCVGRLQYYLDGSPIYSIPICAEETAESAVIEQSFLERLFGIKK